MLTAGRRTMLRCTPRELDDDKKIAD